LPDLSLLSYTQLEHTFNHLSGFPLSVRRIDRNSAGRFVSTSNFNAIIFFLPRRRLSLRLLFHFHKVTHQGETRASVLHLDADEGRRAVIFFLPRKRLSLRLLFHFHKVTRRGEGRAAVLHLDADERLQRRRLLLRPPFQKYLLT
jgi:hypothetical protein